MPDRADLDAALARFHAVGLTPVLSTNRGTRETDILVRRGPRVQGQDSAILDVQITANGQARLDAVKA